MTIDLKGWELEHSDAACPPGTKGGLRVNSICVWARKDGGPWQRTEHRSMYSARKHIEKHGEPELVPDGV